MLKNYIKIGWRNLVKNTLFTFINISGMAISIASFLIIALYIDDELKFDKHVEDVSLKYRVFAEQFTDDGQTKRGSMIAAPIAPALVAEYPEVEYYTRFLNLNTNVLFEAGTKKSTEGKGGYADPTILEMFSLPLVEGDLNTALKQPNTMAIAESLAKKYFGDKPALGATITVSDEPFVVNAVFRDFSSHSHLQLNYFLSMETVIDDIPGRMQSWQWQQFHTYIKVRPGTDASQLEVKLRDFAERNAWPKTKPGGSYYVPHLMPMDKVHLHAGDQTWDIAVKGNAQTVYILSGTAAFILIIAILNFVNLSTARAVSRMKEVGVRKAVGAVRQQLIYQFISESVIIAFIALLIGGVATELALPLLNSFTEKSIPTGIFLNPLLVLGVIVFALLIGVTAGAYPAFYISAYRPALILSNRKIGSSGKDLMRKGMVIFQFILSFFLIIASLVVTEQHTYMRNKDMGFDKDNIIVIPLQGYGQQDLEAVKSTFSSHPNVLGATIGYGLPGEAYAGDGIKDKATNKEWPVSLLTVDHDYLKTLGLKLIAGRDFSKNIPSDEHSAFIVSETTAKMLGYNDPRDVLGHELSWTRWDNPEKQKEGQVIGVVKDFHLNSLRENISPVIIHIYPRAKATLTLRISPVNIPVTIGHLKTSWEKFNSAWPFEYRFLDSNFDKLYKAEQKLAVLFTFFTGFTIFVACLGLFGLVVYSTSQKYKEISIRKVLGAEVSTLVVQLTKNYVLLIAIAFVIAIPVSYYVTLLWLQRFAFRIDVTPLIFVKAAVLIMLVALLTVGIQSFKAAASNPVDALKEQ